MDPVSIVIKAVFTTIQELAKLQALFKRAEGGKLNAKQVEAEIKAIKSHVEMKSEEDWAIVKKGKR